MRLVQINALYRHVELASRGESGKNHNGNNKQKQGPPPRHDRVGEHDIAELEERRKVSTISRTPLRDHSLGPGEASPHETGP